jgi:hypothetical protein
MSIISFESNKFTINMVNGNIESPKNILTKIMQAILDKCPKDVELVYSDYSSIITKDNNKIIASVWKFNLKDLIVNCPLNCFVESGHDYVIVWNIKFYNNDILLSDVHPNANITCAMGYMAQDENRTLFMLGTKAMMFARTLGDSVKLFFADVDPMVDIVANAINCADIKKTKIGFSGIIPIKDYNVNLSFCNGKLTAVIPHKYTMTDNVYGARYSNYSRTVDFANADAVNSFNWDALWDDLYENRNGTCTYRGSLGS